MKRTLCSLFAIAAATVTSLAAAQPITFQQLPAPVQATVTREIQGGAIHEIELDNKRGVTTYEVEFYVAKVKYELEVAADGTLLGRKLDD
jgi:uncharacterized membrane protein YkoI